ncbi:MAG: aldo/keto reductase [Planctomycetota bacterium]|jgi:aryl-alcohol dehydrogenase-like predicted oxidoreductase
MPLDHYVTLGRSGLRVSPFCLGAMTFGEDWGWGATPEDSARIITAYLDRGGNFIDTANIYTKGHSEVILGDYFATGPGKGRRDRVVIATKFMGNLFPGDPNAGGAHRKNVIASLDESLRRLRTDHVDLLWMHWHDPLTPMDETMRTLDDLVRGGKVRYIGFSDTPAWLCVTAQYEAIFRHWTPLVALQIEYSLAERTVEHELIPMARQLGMGVTPWSPLKGGILTGKYRRGQDNTQAGGRSEWAAKVLDDRLLDLVEVLVSVADEAGVTPAQAALAWVQPRPGVASTIIGARTMEQLDANLAALDVTLSDEHRARLDEASAPPPHFPNAFLPYMVSPSQGGTTINGQESNVWHLSPQSEDERW